MDEDTDHGAGSSVQHEPASWEVAEEQGSHSAESWADVGYSGGAGSYIPGAVIAEDTELTEEMMPMEYTKEDLDKIDREEMERQDSETLTAIEKQYSTLHESIPNKIYILGSGAIGKLVAHSLRTLPDPPDVTMLFHRGKLMERWIEGPKEITVNRDDHDIKASGFEAELTHEVRRQYGAVIRQDQEKLMAESPNRRELAATIKGSQLAPEPERRNNYKFGAGVEPIAHLIVTTKTNQTITALLSIRRRIRPWTTICLLQNGMGMIEEINREIFFNPEVRPTYIQGVVTHGANVPPAMAQRDPFYVVHAGQGTISLGLVEQDNNGRPSWSRWLMRQLTRSPALCAVAHTETELLQLQLEKLAVNCVINPLTVLIDNRNGALYKNFYYTRVMRLMLAEIGLVIRSLPELRGLPNVANRFHPNRLEALVTKVILGTAENISSMLADARAGRPTEIRYINGYIIRRGEELGIKCLVNYAMMNTVIGKALMIEQTVQDELVTEASPDLNRGS